MSTEYLTIKKLTETVGGGISSQGQVFNNQEELRQAEWRKRLMSNGNKRPKARDCPLSSCAKTVNNPRTKQESVGVDVIELADSRSLINTTWQN